MDVQVIAAIIALAGIAISLFINLYITRYNFKKEFSKLEVTLIENYTQKIIDERIKYYPLFYYLTSEMGKTLITGKMKIGRESLNINSLKKFRFDMDELNSRYSILFSVPMNFTSKEFRLFVYGLIKDKEEAKIPFKFSDEENNQFYGKLCQFEIALKKDIGLYVVEFQDLKNTTVAKNYEELWKLIGHNLQTNEDK